MNYGKQKERNRHQGMQNDEWTDEWMVGLMDEWMVGCEYLETCL